MYLNKDSTFYRLLLFQELWKLKIKEIVQPLCHPYQVLPAKLPETWTKSLPTLNEESKWKPCSNNLKVVLSWTEPNS